MANPTPAGWMRAVTAISIAAVIGLGTYQLTSYRDDGVRDQQTQALLEAVRGNTNAIRELADQKSQLVLELGLLKQSLDQQIALEEVIIDQVRIKADKNERVLGTFSERLAAVESRLGTQ